MHTLYRQFSRKIWAYAQFCWHKSCSYIGVVAFSRVKISLNFNELRHTPILNIYNKISTYILSAKETQNVHSKYNSKDSNCRQRPWCYHTQKAVSDSINLSWFTIRIFQNQFALTIYIMAVRVVEFSSEGYKIRKIFG